MANILGHKTFNLRNHGTYYYDQLCMRICHGIVLKSSNHVKNNKRKLVDLITHRKFTVQVSILHLVSINS